MNGRDIDDSSEVSSEQPRTRIPRRQRRFLSSCFLTTTWFMARSQGGGGVRHLANFIWRGSSISGVVKFTWPGIFIGILWNVVVLHNVCRKYSTDYQLCRLLIMYLLRNLINFITLFTVFYIRKVYIASKNYSENYDLI